MPSTFTTNLSLEKPGDGEQDGFWSFSLNGNFNTIDDAITAALQMGGSAPTAPSPIDGARRLTIPEANEIVVEEYDSGVPEWATIFDSRDKQDAGVGIMPAGGIIMWSGSVASIPSGWVLCDGTNSTPDLRNRFVIGANGTYAPGATGGSLAAVTSTSAGAHDHGGATGSTVLTEAQTPVHSHLNGVSSLGPATFVYAGVTTGMPGAATANFDIDAGAGDYQGETSEAGSGEGHTHTVASAGAHTHDVTPTLPPYYALCFIMKQ